MTTREESIENLINLELNDKSRGDNHDVYERRLLDPGSQHHHYVPRCIYFYYVRVDESAKVRIDNYFYVDGDQDDRDSWKEIPYDDVPRIIKDLALNGRPRRRKKPPARPGATFEDVVWKHRSYVAIYFDEANWAFHQRRSGFASVVFNVTSGAMPNNSFFDAKDLTIRMPKGKHGRTDNRTAIFFVNHMKDAAGDTMGHLKLDYKFDMYMKVKYSKTNSQTMTVIIDPGGSNEGPPEQP